MQLEVWEVFVNVEMMMYIVSMMIDILLYI